MADSVAVIEADESTISSPQPSSTRTRAQRMDYSHKMTEKRRRDRINISMSEIAKLLPTSPATKQLEKAEILEKTINYIKKLQDLTENRKSSGTVENSKQTDVNEAKSKDDLSTDELVEQTSRYYNGFSDCVKEVFHCLTNVEAMDLQESCFQRLMGHLVQQLQFMIESEEGQTGRQSKLDKPDGNFLTQSSTNGRVDSLSLAEADSCCRKRAHSSDRDYTVERSSQSPGNGRKRAHLSMDKSQHNFKKCSTDHSSNSSKEEKTSEAMSTSSSISENGCSVSNEGSSSCGSEKGKGGILPELTPSSKIESKSSHLNGVKDGVNGSAGMNGSSQFVKLANDIPIHATPLSPRASFIPSPLCVPTYALHPSGTHYMPVLLHPGFLRPFSEMNGCLSSVPPCWPRMGGLQFPHIPYGFPLFPHVGGFTGLNGVYNSKNDSAQKNCDQGASAFRNEHTGTNDSTTRDLLNHELD